ncbi:hypothetical protein CO026_00015 [Candidatus Kaiserbacteria bacterium CG_4_9_14_0_2_um_filter_41_32]|uniref:Uncharacterized protein n=1 Tax=Candidatus Kaiserbacteria bacterium CG_4_9_14_0_2_um_filter_41_32 TaxID=1974601 RepID=A0A2M8FFR7_9BACT|nr:MAG: hypothetical protein COY24_04130 [Candidatus Uhrbacteria bacterium CG_4_10_14_0_2_um_filter_41_21]PJC56489.1 MAG: hypothetical protein CO026_00015 [Candidatus Kaiserbacteria bacterium CG_4_9_14_0_2_um_filter_41_32]
MNKRVVKISNNNNHVYFSLLGLTLITLLFLYVYFLSASVVHVVLRKQAITNTANIESQIAQLETSYISAQHSISNKIASSEGFSENSKKIFVSRAVPTFAMSASNF